MIIHLYNTILNYSRENHSLVIEEYDSLAVRDRDLCIYKNPEGVFMYSIHDRLNDNYVRYNYRSLISMDKSHFTIHNRFIGDTTSIPLNYL